jgi:SAM-dependent methyltransferase
VLTLVASAQSVPPYGDDLAYIHDIGFNNFANGSAPGLLEILQQAEPEGNLIVDLGCGSGIWAAHLCQAGYRVVGVDISSAMIELARKRAPDAEFRVGSFQTFEFPRCAAITALSDVLCYQFDAANDRRSLVRLFHRAFDALEPAGLFVFDIAEVGLDKGQSPRFCEGKDWVCFIRYKYDDLRDHLIRHIVTFRKYGTLYRRHVETHRLQLYRRSDIVTMLKCVGFRVQTTRLYGDFDLMAGRVGFVASKE